MTFEEYMSAEQWKLGHAYLSDMGLMRFLQLTFQAGYASGKSDALDVATAIHEEQSERGDRGDDVWRKPE